MKKISKAYFNRKHKKWFSATPEYRVWSNMKQLCTNPRNKSYKYYGGKGIKICDRWLNSAEDFVKDMGKRPSSKHRIDRIDNNGNYDPDNCRWVLQKESTSISKAGKFWFIYGVKYHSLKEASIALNKSPSVIKFWCDGRPYKDRISPPRPHCYSELKYKDKSNG